jgi:hypothetical protein
MKNIEKLEQLPSYEAKRFVRNQERNYEPEPFPYAHLDGFLMKNRGQSFDDVYSEYSHADWVPVQYRNLDFFKNFVEVDTFIGNDGLIYYNARWYPVPVSIDSSYRVQLFYIHPTTKKLECYQRKVSRTKIKYKWKKDLENRFRLIGPGHQLIKLKGIWYDLTFGVIEYERNFKDGVWSNFRVRSEKEINRLLNSVYKVDEFSQWSSYRYYRIYKDVKFKQLNSKELKKNNLKND